MRVAIRYAKSHPSYVQRVTLEMRDGSSRVFGYDDADATRPKNTAARCPPDCTSPPRRPSRPPPLAPASRRYDYTGWVTTCCEVYSEAYARQWAAFTAMCAPGGDDEERSEARLQGYGRTSARLEQAAEVLGL